MAEIKEFVINDRRKFTADGEPNPNAAPSEPRPIRNDAPLESSASSAAAATPAAGPQLVPDAATAPPTRPAEEPEPQLPPLSATQIERAADAYEATVARIDVAMREQNPGMAQMPPMTFERLVQSIYMQAMLQLGAGTEPNQAPQVDLLGARQSIDMLAVFSEKTRNNLMESEQKLLEAALFELHMAFLELTQMLTRQATAARQPIPPPPGGGPSLIR